MHRFHYGLVALGLLVATPALAQTAPSASPAATVGDSVKGAATKAKDALGTAADKAGDATEKVIEKGKDAAGAVRDKAVETKKKITGEPLIDINSADVITLSSLKGIGPVRAAAIVNGRPYHSKNELVTKDILPESVYEGIKDEVVAKHK